MSSVQPQSMLEALLSKAARGLEMQRERLAEEFMMSGAMPRDLCMEVGPIEADTSRMCGDDHLWTVRQDVRMV